MKKCYSIAYFVIAIHNISRNGVLLYGFRPMRRKYFRFHLSSTLSGGSSVSRAFRQLDRDMTRKYIPKRIQIKESPIS